MSLTCRWCHLLPDWRHRVLSESEVNSLKKINLKPFVWCVLGEWPGREVCGTEVDEEVPFPVEHGQQVLHAAQVGLQQTGPAPDSDHAPGCGPHVWVQLSHVHNFPMQVVGALQERHGDQICLHSSADTCVDCFCCIGTCGSHWRCLFLLVR